MNTEINDVPDAKSEWKERGVKIMDFHKLAEWYMKQIQDKNPEYHDRLYQGDARFPRWMYKQVYGYEKRP